jgi:hypothetical protein
MCTSQGPYDLNIPVSCSSTTTVLEMVRRALVLGYRTIALNTEVSARLCHELEKGLCVSGASESVHHQKGQK